MPFHAFEFMFLFLPAAFAAYWLARRAGPGPGGLALTGLSLAFYGWGDGRLALLLAASIAVNHLIAGRIAAAGTAAGRGWLAAGVAANLGVLALFKYLDLALALAGMGALGLALPVGLSFYAFLQIAYLVELQGGRAPALPAARYAGFVAFFPHLVAGPLSRWRDIGPQLTRAAAPEAGACALGLSLFVAGLAKKVVLADPLGGFADPVFAAVDAGLAVSTLEAWGGTLAYALQLYFDFSGYCDMALGVGLLFGVRLPINFDSPYKAVSIVEFWRRWHITLSHFLRDHLYFPLGGGRRGPARRTANLIATMALGGIWHGAGWGFLVWGLLHGLYLAVNHALRAVLPAGGGPARRLAGWAATFLAVTWAWVFFRAQTLDGALALSAALAGLGPATGPEALGRLLGAAGLDPAALAPLTFAGPAHAPVGMWARTGAPLIGLGLLLALAAPNTNDLFLARDPHWGRAAPRAWAWRPSGPWLLGLLAVFALALSHAGSVSGFLYGGF